MREQLEQILREAGNIILSAKRADKAVREKEGNANFVTRFDVEVQRFLKEKLLEWRPQAKFVGEEEDARADVLHGESFIVDPIDGTTNFIRGLDTSAISVALLRDGEVIAGAAFDPYRDEFYFAEKGRGTLLNGSPVHVSDLPLEKSLVAFGTSPYYAELIPQTFALAQKLMEYAADLRRTGSAVVDLCQLSRGSTGLMFEFRLSPWDYAAGSLLVTEAGGVITQLDGSPLRFDRPCSVLAGSPKAHADFFAQGLDKACGKPEQKITFREVTENKKQYLALLQLADDQEDMIDRYLDRGRMYVLEEDGKVCAECVVTDEGGGILEIKNLAVDESCHRRGYGRRMIAFTEELCRGKYPILQVGTGESPLTVPFYEACGFRYSHRVPDFFTDNYDPPIYDGGVLLTDMVYFRKTIE